MLLQTQIGSFLLLFFSATSNMWWHPIEKAIYSSKALCWEGVRDVRGIAVELTSHIAQDDVTVLTASSAYSQVKRK